MKNIHHHFANVAPKYRDLRTTDNEPVAFIEKKVRNLEKIRAADVGCGAGRYVLKFFEHFGEKLDLLCLDCNDEMLYQLESHLHKHGIRNFKTKIAGATKIPIKNDSLDCVFTFNAIHHFQLADFFAEAARILRTNGLLFVYTRLQSQNRTTIWGKYFPNFYKKESRLYQLNQIKQQIRKTENLSLESVKFFSYKRRTTLQRLIEQALHHHYSTFYLYDKKEFNESLEKFKLTVWGRFGSENVFWTDKNTMFVIKKI